MEAKGSKYINLLSQDLESKKSILNNLKYLLFKQVCNNNSIANYQLEELININFKCKNKRLKILDIGAGICNYFPKNVKNSNNKYYACDLSEDLQYYLEKRGIIFKKGDLTKNDLEIEKNFFDIIICSHVIEHLDDPNNLLFAISSLLKQSGILLLKTPDINIVKWNFFNDFTHKKPYTIKSLEQQISSERINIIKCKSSTLYKDFALSLIKKNPLNPFNFIFLIIGIYTYLFRKDMREIICIAKKIQ